MITIVVPSARDISKFVLSIDESLVDIEYNIIVVSPERKEIPFTKLQKTQRLIVDKGSPSRCLQMGISECLTDIFMWGTDDGVLQKEQLKKCYNNLTSKTYKDGIVLKYTEYGGGNPSTLSGADDDYYMSGNHGANLLPGINPKWKIAPVGMFYTSYFKELGGLDCRFEHINFNVHDFVYRLQRSGGRLFFSDGVVLLCDSDPNNSFHRPIHLAYHLNDYPLFREIYKDNSRGVKIDFNNWKDSPDAWRRFT